MPDPSPTSPVRGEQVLAGRYRLVRPIASGGMAQVWEAVDAILDRPVAVKVLHPHLASDEQFVARFRAEAISAARLTHPGIVSIYDTYSDGGTEAIIMELVRGTTLRHLLDHRGQLPPDEAVVIADHIAAALEAAHGAGIVHRDIKPANVLLSADGRVLVADFGIAKAIEGTDLTAERTMLGTAKYLAPEQVDGSPVDGRTDLFALGVVLYEMLTGRVPFSADTEAATALARLHRLPDPLRAHRPGVSASLEQVVMDCLARRPEERPANAAALRRVLAGTDRSLATTNPAPTASVTTAAPVAQPVPPPPAVPPSVPAQWTAPPPGPPRYRARQRAKWLAAGLILIALGVGAILMVVIVQGGDADQILRITGATTFDPLGDNRENDSAAPLAVDGDPATAWSTEIYVDPAALAGKAGVGLIVKLDSPSILRKVMIDSPSSNWSVSIYGGDRFDSPDPSQWVPPIAKAEKLAPGVNTIDLAHSSTAYEGVLIWITRAGDDGSVKLAEVTVRGRRVGR